MLLNSPQILIFTHVTRRPLYPVSFHSESITVALLSYFFFVAFVLCLDLGFHCCRFMVGSIYLPFFFFPGWGVEKAVDAVRS